MALLNSISSANRVVEQGNTYQYNVEPAITISNVAIQDSTLYDKITVRQWHGVLHFSKRYKYVGLDESTANSWVATILAAYSIDVSRWGVGLYVVSATDYYYCYLLVGTAPMSCATVTPVHEDGGMWSVEVDVDATFDMYTTASKTSAGTAPTASTLIALANDIAGFPESSQSSNSNNNGGES